MENEKSWFAIIGECLTIMALFAMWFSFFFACWLKFSPLFASLQ